MPKQNILIVDDDITIVTIIKKALSDNGYASLCAVNGNEALETLASHDNIDAIILDIMMPQVDGRETLRNIKQNDKIKHLPILMLTGQNAVSDVSECLSLGANDYMVKPFDPNTLIARLQQILPMTLAFGGDE